MYNVPKIHSIMHVCDWCISVHTYLGKSGLKVQVLKCTIKGVAREYFFCQALAEYICQLHDRGSHGSCLLCYRADTFSEAVASVASMHGSYAPAVHAHCMLTAFSSIVSHSPLPSI